MIKFYHAATLDQIFRELNSSLAGLSSAEAKQKLAQSGPNALPDPKVPGGIVIFLSQFISPLILILILAGVAILFLGETIDAIIIFLVLLFNAIIGAVQEGKAQNTLLALKKFVTTTATVWRDEKTLIVPDYEIVPGDIISLAEGDKVPADARIISANSFKVNEASFTGESVPLSKTTEVIRSGSLPPQSQRNMVFKGTHVVGGNARAIVTATGLNTEIGHISQAISKIDTEIPLKANIRALSRFIIIVVGIMSALILGVGIFFGHSWVDMFALVVSLAVSVIPEGLPIVMTLVLASGVWRMTKRQVLVKKLQAVEALGQARIIAVDKTGTLTRNELVIKRVYVDGQLFQVSGDGYDPSGEISLQKNPINPLDHPALILLSKISSFCSGVRVLYDEKEKIWRIAGDPTEAAMDVFAKKVGFKETDQEAPLVLDLPFDHLTKYHITIRQTNQNNFLSLTGAPEVVLEKCSQIYRAGKIERITIAEKKELINIFLKLSVAGLRVLACAVNQKAMATISPDNLPPLAFVGFLGMQDALRVGVRETVKQVSAAGMRVIMITGDHPVTALAIAKDAGITSLSEAVLTGEELDKLPDKELIKRFAKTSVFARVTPNHKLRIIELFRQRGEVVAMTGDGVNDAPSLAAADLGVAMGKIGTEVAKEAADLILLDDNFSNIVAAAEEGRSIYKTIRKVILYLFSTSAGEAIIIGSAVFINFPLPLLPAQIIWLNFVTDGFLDVALAMEKKEKGLLDQKFIRPSKYILDHLSFKRLILMAILMAIGSLILFAYYLRVEPLKALTVSLTVMAVFQWFNAWNCKSERRSIFSKDFWQNLWLVGATLVVILLQILAIYHPFFQGFLHTTALNLRDWLLIVAVASIIIWPEELWKWGQRKKIKI